MKNEYDVQSKLGPVKKSFLILGTLEDETLSNIIVKMKIIKSQKLYKMARSLISKGSNDSCLVTQAKPRGISAVLPSLFRMKLKPGYGEVLSWSIRFDTNISADEL